MVTVDVLLQDNRCLVNIFFGIDPRRLPIIGLSSYSSKISQGSLTSRTPLERGISLPLNITSDRSHYRSSIARSTSVPTDFEHCGAHFREELKRRRSLVAGIIPTVTEENELQQGHLTAIKRISGN